MDDSKQTTIDEFNRGWAAGWAGANALAGMEFYRLKCLEIAAQSFHPDEAIPPDELVHTAEMLLRYVREGDWSRGLDETTINVADPGSVPAGL